MFGFIARGRSFALLAALFLHGLGARAQNSGKDVVVVFNSDMPESRQVAEYYAQKREVPSEQVIGLSLPQSESITRKEFNEKLQKPLWEELVKRKLFTPPEPSSSDAITNKLLTASKIRYATLCYGVPLKIAKDTGLKEPAAEKIPQELRRNEAAVDSELALLPIYLANLPLVGGLANPAFGTTNVHNLHPTNGVMMVARLDGPTADLARGLVDKALQAEKDGLWGRAYIDTRGITNGPYASGDEWMRGAADLSKRFGFETVVDNNASTFPASFPMSQIALYFGWYDWNVSGPLAAAKPEFMPGAIAYHLHSFSAQTIRSRDQNWVGPLIARGVTATMGCTEEPYLVLTPDVQSFAARLLFLGFTFGEAAYACQHSLSWQTTVVGDPLYAPFGKPLQQRHEEFVREKNKLIEWSHLAIVNRNLYLGTSFDDLVNYIERTPDAKTSSVLQEKLADLYRTNAKLLFAVDPYVAALKLETSPLQRLRISLSAGWLLALFDKDLEAYDLYKTVVKDFPDYPDLKEIYGKLAALAKKLGKTDEAEDYKKRAS